MEQKEQEFAYGIEITLPKPDSFSIIMETLTRVGIKSKRGNTLYQSCHILHKRGRYFVVHFLELFRLDGKNSEFSDDDYRRRNTIAKLLDQWGLCKVINRDVLNVTCSTEDIAVIPYKEKKNYELVSKYTVGKR